MQKYKIKFGEEAITDEEILHFKDFNQVLKKHETVTWQSAFRTRLWNGISLATAVIVLGVSYYFYEVKSHPAPPSSAGAGPPEVAVVPDRTQKVDQPEPMEETSPSPEHTASVPSHPPQENAPAPSSAAPAEPVEEVAPDAEQTETPLHDAPLTYIDADRKEDVFTEAMPIDGYPALYRYFRTNLQYPEQATIDKVSGTVIIGFSINKNGKPSNIQVIEGVNKSIDREATRLIEHMPPWVPAMVNDIPITTRLVIPITFQLTHLEKKSVHQQ